MALTIRRDGNAADDPRKGVALEELTRSRFLKKAGAAAVSLSAAGVFAGRAGDAFAAAERSAGLVPYSGPIGATAYPATILSVPVLVAYNKGFFKQQKLDLHMTVMNSATDLARAIHARQVAFGVGGILTVMSGFAAGMNEIRLIGQMDGAQYMTFLTKPDSPIHTPADLKGKKVAVLTNTKNLSYWMALQMLKAGGLAAADVNFLFLPSFPAIAAALENGVTDVGVSIKPVSTQQVVNGQARMIWDTGVIKNLPDDGVFTSVTFADTHAQVCRQFSTAIAQAQQWARHNVQETAAMWSKVTQIDPKVCLGALQGPVVNSFQFSFPVSGFYADRAVGVSLGSVPSTTSYYAFVDPRFMKGVAKYSK